MRYDPIVVPEEHKPAAPGTEIGKTTIKIIDLDKYPEYEFSEALIGNARPLQPFGQRSLWATPEVV